MDFSQRYGDSTTSTLVTKWAQFFEKNFVTLFDMMKNKMAKKSLNDIDDIDNIDSTYYFGAVHK